jgi:UDP-N-acetylmuramoyl-L-alanine---L-glutamate ligase
MNLAELHGRRLVVWGAGREGRSAVELFAHSSQVSIVSDRGSNDAGAVALAEQVGTVVALPTPEVLRSADFIIRAPGVSKYRDELRDALHHGVGSASLLSLWLADDPLRQVIGVTGTKGKSTTASLIAQLLIGHGVDVQLGGNIGVPVTDLVAASWYVVEVSSYQAADCTTSPTIGVLTTLDQDHLPWHGTVDQYRADKLNLFAHPGLRQLVVNALDPVAVAATSHVASRQLAGSSSQRHGAAPLVIEGRAVTLSEVLQRSHNRVNLDVALAAVHCALPGALDPACVEQVTATFAGLPARQQLVGVVGDVRYIDDAIASNPLGACAALDVFDDRPLVMVMGGADRQVDLAPLVRRLGQVQSLRAVIAVGPLGRRLVDELSHHLHQRNGALPPSAHNVAATQLITLDDDVARAVVLAAELANPGDTVLFSPGAPTTPEVGTYLERSQLFRDAVAALA